MSARVCTCIRDPHAPASVAVLSPDCWHQADLDAHRTAHALAHLIRWTARIALAVILLWLYGTDTPDMTPWHWLAAALALPIAWLGAPTRRTP